MSTHFVNRTHGVWKPAFSLFLSALLTLSPGLSLANEKSGSAASGRLSVASDPAGAAVYVDGQFAGQTPLNVDRVAAGDHRVRVVKDGYLENGRIVSVSAGRPSSVEVKLTRHEGPNEATAAMQAGSGSTGGGSKKWLWIGLAGAGAGVGTYFAVRDTNKAPSGGAISTTPAIGLAASTAVAFSSTASDPDGDTLTFAWNFGDGSTGTGASPTHTYASAGSFTIGLTVSDGKKSATATGSVTIKSLSGTWRGQLSGTGFIFNTTVTFTQSGTNLTGTYVDQFGFNGTIAGTVSGSSPRVTYSVTIPRFQPFTFTGDPDVDVNRLSGTVNGSGFVGAPWTQTRQ